MDLNCALHLFLHVAAVTCLYVRKAACIVRIYVTLLALAIAERGADLSIVNATATYGHTVQPTDVTSQLRVFYKQAPIKTCARLSMALGGANSVRLHALKRAPARACNSAVRELRYAVVTYEIDLGEETCNGKDLSLGDLPEIK